MLPVEDDRGVVREVPQAAGLHPEGREAERRVRDLRARRLLRLPQDEGLRRTCRKPGPILTKIDSKLTPDWVKTWIRNPRAVKPTTWMPRFWYNSNNSSPEDARAERGRDQRDRRVSVREHREARVRREEPAARRREARRGDRQVDRLPGLPRRRRGIARRGRARAGRSASRSRTSATRRPTSGSTTGCAIRSTTARRPTCRTCA